MVEWKDRAAHLASRYVNGTGCHVFLTGRAGTGKTTFLHDIRRRTHKNTIVAAPTGIAAINAEGVTLHSLFQLPFGSFIPQEIPPGEPAPGFEISTPQSLRRGLKMQSAKRNMLKKLELLIIDEVSMLRADLLDAVDAVLRLVRRRPGCAFGGVQVLFIGDLYQLPPVVKEAEWKVLNQFYPTMFFFGARALAENDPVYIEL
ncbi:MAG: AAA family ATPase, partial [Desulfosalsimonas sp.]